MEFYAPNFDFTNSSYNHYNKFTMLKGKKLF